MSISKVSTLTSGVLAITDSSLIDEKQIEILNKKKKSGECCNIILAIESNSDKCLNYDEQISLIHKLGFKIIVSDSFTSIFSAKAISYGILTIEVSKRLLNKIVESSISKSDKLFVDLKGQEVMIIYSGEKEYFELSEYNRERLENGRDEFESLHAVWDDLDYSYKKDEVLDFVMD